MKTSTPVKQNVRQKQASARRQQILEVAVRLFAQKGVARTTTRQIAQEAGAAEGLIFGYFPTKLDLVRAVTGTPHVVLGDLRKNLEESKTQSVEEVIGQIATVWLELLHRESDIFSILFGEALINPEIGGILHQVIEEGASNIGKFLDASKQAGRMTTSVDTKTVAHMYMSSILMFFKGDTATMKLVIFGANGPTGLELCRQAITAGHHVVAVVRRPNEFPLRDKALTVLEAHVMDGSSLASVIDDADAVLSTLGAAYSRHEIRIYSISAKAIVEAMRASDHCHRLVVGSAGLAARNLPKVRGFFQDNVALPILRNVIGRTLYEDLLRMEDFLSTCNDIEWTIIRPGRLINGTSVSEYRLAEDFPVGNVTTRPDLAAAILAELGLNGHIHQKISPTTR